ncbi:hypothetical protein [Salirhabdus sp. Marseille-P4669]|uniref:hypothetical protein n=1 Tax=Salirhabdus sp. Marseille-P4669 TaxID=2042310 RepID=UPI000C7C1A05|nr:hypothetical protein [Salirhabdus sp. Marseille-P4669]
MIWLVIFIPLLFIIGITLLIDRKNKMGDLETSIDQNQYRDESFAYAERYKDLNDHGHNGY